MSGAVRRALRSVHALNLIALMCVVGCRPVEAPVAIAEAWSPPSPPGAPAVVYLRIIARDADVLASASTPIAERTEMHTTLRSADGMMQMQPLAALPIASGETARFEPGGHHFMLTGLKAPQTSGASFPLTLRFAKAGEVTTSVAVRPLQEQE